MSERSALLPTSTIITSFPRSDRTSSIHFDVDMNDVRSTGSHQYGSSARSDVMLDTYW